MYARIAFDAGWIAWKASTLNTRYIALKPLSELEARRPLGLAAQSVERVFERQPGNASAAEQAQDKQRVSSALAAIVPWLHGSCLNDPDNFDFTIHCAIAHHRLPDVKRLARESRIAAIRDSLVADAPSLSDTLGDLWETFKRLGILLPDVFLDSHLRNTVGQALTASCLVALARQQPTPLSALLAVLPMPGRSARPTEAKFFQLMVRLYLSRALADRPVLIELIRKAQELKQYEWPIRASELLQAAEAANVNPVIQQDCLFCVLRDTLTLKDEQLRQNVLLFQLDQLVEMQRARTQQVVQLTIDAVLDGVPLGDTFTDQVKAALAAEQEATDRAERSADARRLHALHGFPAAPVQVQTTPTDQDPVHTWSVERLAAWIEGPVTRLPIDRQRIAQRERLLARERKQRRAQAAVAVGQAKHAPAEPMEPEPELELEDINLAVDDALRTTAAFFRDDLSEMIALAKQLGVGPAAIRQAMEQRELMVRLASSHSGVSDEQVRTGLQAAEAATAQLRAAIQRSQTNLRQCMGFTQGLNAALQQEALVKGKRQGGKIAFPMPLSSWQWVFDTFHGQWLHQKRRLEIDNHPVPLRSDQALALYVTGSSQSGFAFDISVHLWQRRPDANSLPCVDTDGVLRMNTEDWFDTYTPCAVLHVPLGK